MWDKITTKMCKYKIISSNETEYMKYALILLYEKWISILSCLIIAAYFHCVFEMFCFCSFFVIWENIQVVFTSKVLLPVTVFLCCMLYALHIRLHICCQRNLYCFWYWLLLILWFFWLEQLIIPIWCGIKKKKKNQKEKPDV